MIRIDFDKTTGYFKKLNGVGMAPAMNSILHYEIQRQYYSKLNIQAIRLHDAPLNNPGMRLVDIHQIFSDFNADPEDPGNYYFAQTDDYLKPCADAGIEVLYRLGESIEHSINHYFIAPPADYEKWADICCHIAEHYTRGWANGFHWKNMKDWVVLCEPNEPKIWAGTFDEYLHLYEVTAKKFAERLPELRLGGPALGGCNPEMIEKFLAFCHDRKLKLDFITWNQYAERVDAQIEQPRTVKVMAEKYGYGNLPLQIGEWHYLNRGWSGLLNPDTGGDADDPRYGMNGYNAAAYTAAVLAGWQDEPVERAYFYTGNKGIFGIFDSFGVPKKTAYAIEAYGRVLRCPERVAVDMGGELISPQERRRLHGDIRVLAGKDGSECVVMIAAFFCICCGFEIEICGLQDFDVSILVTDKEHDQAPAAFIRKGNVLEIMKHSSSAVYLIHLHRRNLDLNKSHAY